MTGDWRSVEDLLDSAVSRRRLPQRGASRRRGRRGSLRTLRRPGGRRAREPRHRLRSVVSHQAVRDRRLVHAPRRTWEARAGPPADRRCRRFRVRRRAPRHRHAPRSSRSSLGPARAPALLRDFERRAAHERPQARRYARGSVTHTTARSGRAARAGAAEPGRLQRRRLHPARTAHRDCRRGGARPCVRTSMSRRLSVSSRPAS